MDLNRACSAQPGHRRYKRSNINRPVVLSADRYNAIADRSTQKERRENEESVQEEQRYKEYLKEGSDALVRKFTNLVNLDVIYDKQQADRNAAIALIKQNSEIQRKQLDEARKKRIIEADRLVQRMKPGPRTFRQALVETETVHQRNYQLALKREFEEDAREQQILDDQQCPEILIPFGSVTEEQEKAELLVKKNELRDCSLRDIKERRVRKLNERDQAQIDHIADRARNDCLLEKEEQENKDRLNKRREFHRNAYREALQEKADRAKFEAMRDGIDDRNICVSRTTHRNLSGRYNAQIKSMRENRTRVLQAHALEYCQQQHAKKMQELEKEDVALQRFEIVEQEKDEKRKSRIAQLTQERRQYEVKNLQNAGEKRTYEAELKRFDIANRLKNEQVNEKFAAIKKKKQEQICADLRNILCSQRDKLLQQRQQELMRLTTCDEDPYLVDDTKFFDTALSVMEQSKELGRPLYRLNQAVEEYKRDNLVDVVPQARTMQRNEARDKCWPGFVSKAQLAYRKYEYRENCKRKQLKARQQIFDNCLKISKMAAEDRPAMKCTMVCPMKLMQNADMPPMENMPSMEMPGFVCEEMPPPPAVCPDISKREETVPKDEAPFGPLGPSEELAVHEKHTPSFKSAKSENSLKTPSQRVSGGGGCDGKVLAYGTKSRITRSPDLTHCWTAKPRAKVEVDNFPVISSINHKYPIKLSPNGTRPGNRKQFE